MRIGVPTEVKAQEYRVALVPAGVRALVGQGHQVLVQAGAGLGSTIEDQEYRAAGATLVTTAEDVWAADLVLKVKEPVGDERELLRPGLVLLTFLHLAADRELTEHLLASRVTAIGYETVQDGDGSLPLLAPMSEIAGRMAPHVGANLLHKPTGGRGVLLGGVAGVTPGTVVVLGGGTAGINAVAIALGLRAAVTLVDLSVARLREVDVTFAGRVQTLASSELAVEHAVLGADLVIGAALVPGARAPVLVPDELVAAMRPGSVLVDIAVDQGGNVGPTRPTTHAAPTIDVHGSLLYAVANMPGAVPSTSTRALTNVTLPHVRRLADDGWPDAVRRSHSLARGVNTVDGALVHPGVAQAHRLACSPLTDVLGR